jgi:hypothetical protein
LNDKGPGHIAAINGAGKTPTAKDFHFSDNLFDADSTYVQRIQRLYNLIK